MIGLRQTILVLLAAAAVPWGRAQSGPVQTRLSDPHFVVREWHAEEGLPHEDVLQLLQDRRGYLWVASRDGLARFDGTTFLPCAAPEARQTFLWMAEDADGSLLLTPRSGDPVRYRGGVFTKEPLPSPYTGRPIGNLLLSPDGARWYSLRGAVLRVTQSDVQAFGPTDGISAQNWTRFAVDGQGRVWLASDLLLARYEEGRLVRVPLITNGTGIRIASTRHGGPWVITDSQVLKLDESQQVVEIAKIPPLIGSHYVNAACEDRNGLLWLGTRSQGVHLIGPDRQLHVPTSSDNIVAMMEDRDGTIWVGANTGGLNAIVPKVYALYDKSSGLTATAVSAICEDNAGDIWVANGDGGVVRLRGSQIEKWLLRHDSRVFAAGSVTRHPEGGVWVTGGTGSALFHVTGDSDRALLVEDVPSGGIYATDFTAKSGDLWAATADRRVGRLRGHTYQTFGPADGVSANGVRTFAETAGGDILVGTNEGTLLRFDGTRFVAVLPPEARAASAINAIHIVGDQFWLGTASNGLIVCAGAQVVHLDSDHGLPDDNITQFVPDDQGNLWCGSGRGVFRLRVSDVQRFVRGETRTVSALRLGKDEGLGTITCQGLSGPGAVTGRDGRIWFATRQGVLAIDPAAQALTPRPPTVTIEQVRTDDVPQAPSRPFIVNPQARKIELRFSVLCLAAPSRVRTRYRLTGFDTEWVVGGSGRVATYPRLAPGTYRFEVAAGFGDPTVAESTDSVEIVMPRRWWQTIWFQIAAFGVLVAGVTLVVRAWSHRRLRLQIEKLERESAVDRERARIARNIHDDVGASLTRISLLTQATSPNSPEAEKLNRIYETAREITRSFDEIVWAVNPHYDTLESFISYLTDFAQQFLGVAGIRCRLDIPATLPSIPLSSDTRHDLFLCCREALNNVVKHAAASEVVVRLIFTAPRLVIIIADNGRGMSSGRAEPAAGRVSAGHGVGNLRQRMERRGGSCTIESPASGGTTVTLTIEISPTSPISS